ncbi:MAG: cupredoxin family copper-binding protein [Thermoleophilia bacterium]|nr:cupredoxin family copper-binding protein [Thermoleophilia bacterium]
MAGAMCPGDDEEEAPPDEVMTDTVPEAPADPPPIFTPVSVEVSISGLNYVPEEVTTDRGATVIWTNNDSVDHTVTADDASFDSGTISQGESFKYIFNQSGSYPYHCAIHPEMTGMVTVR